MGARWEEVAARLDVLIAGPTADQKRVAKMLRVKIPDDLPAPVAAVRIKAAIADALMERLNTGVKVPQALNDLETDLGVSNPAKLTTSSREEVSAWFAARYALKTSQGLKELQPVEGCVVRGPDPIGHRVVSSVGKNGRVYLKGLPLAHAWPNHLVLVARPHDEGFEQMVTEIDAALRNGRRTTTVNMTTFGRLEPYRLASHVPSLEAVRELEDLLESGETKEPPFQSLIERHPQLLSSLVLGNWAIFVIPQKRLGAEHVTDFLVLGVHSLGPQWVAVELEAPRHRLHTEKGRITAAVQHGVDQIQDWRDWLTQNVSYAQSTLHLQGITNQLPGLVVIGRSQPSDEREPARSRVAEQQNIQIHSWDWVLRQAQRMIETGFQDSPLNIVSADEEKWIL